MPRDNILLFFLSSIAFCIGDIIYNQLCSFYFFVITFFLTKFSKIYFFKKVTMWEKQSTLWYNFIKFYYYYTYLIRLQLYFRYFTPRHLRSNTHWLSLTDEIEYDIFKRVCMIERVVNNRVKKKKKIKSKRKRKVENMYIILKKTYILIMLILYPIF